MYGSERPRKRVKALIACEECQKAKSRCEYESGACHRCARLIKACSFVENPPTLSSTAPSTAHTSNVAFVEPSSALNVTREVVDALGQTIASGVTGRIIPLSSENEEPMLVISHTQATHVGNVSSTLRGVLWERPLDLFVKMLAITWSSDLLSANTTNIDPSWLARPALPDDELQRIAEAQDLATWSKEIKRPADLFDLNDNAQIARMRSARVDLSSASASQEARLLNASVIVSEGVLDVLNYRALPVDFVTTIRDMLDGTDTAREAGSELLMHASLLAAVDKCSTADALANLPFESFRSALRDALKAMDDAFFDVKLAHCTAQAGAAPYLFGLYCHASFYRVLARCRIIRSLTDKMMSFRTSEPALCKELREGTFMPLVLDFTLFLLDGISPFIAFAQQYPERLASAPDVLLIGAAFVAEAIVRCEVNIRDWVGSPSWDLAAKSRLLKHLGAALWPSYSSPLHARPLCGHTARICFALASVLEDVTLPSLSFNDIFAGDMS